jgi:hypothetical protein
MNESIELEQEHLDALAAVTPYHEWSPTGFDCAGLNLPDFQDWLVCPAMINRDTLECSLEMSNYEVILHRLRAVDGLPVNAYLDWFELRPGSYSSYTILNHSDETGLDYMIASFDHWAVGWFNIILVRPNTACHRVAAEAQAEMADYPILDDEDFSMRESDWKWKELPEYIKNLKEDLPSDWEDDVLGRMHYEEIAGDGSISWSHDPQEIAEELGYVDVDDEDDED